jgi:ankyrin repeat protein
MVYKCNDNSDYEASCRYAEITGHGIDERTEFSDRTPLMRASLDGNIPEALELLSMGANPNLSPRFSGVPPLGDALKAGNSKLVSILVEYQADVDFVSESTGKSLLHQSAEIGDTNAVKELLIHKAQVNILDCSLETPLMLAARNGHIETLKLLLEKRAKPNLQNLGGRSALMLAAEAGHLSCVKILVAYGASISLMNNPRSLTACKFAKKNRHREVQAFLEKVFDDTFAARSAVKKLNFLNKAAKKEKEKDVKSNRLF